MKMSNAKKSILASGIIVLGTLAMFSCNKSNTAPSGPKPPSNPGGYDSSNQVASANLVAYWSFNNTLTESKQNLSGTNYGSSFTTGVKGMAYQGGPSSYVLYANPGTALPALNSFTISFWIDASQPINDTSGKIIPGQGAQGLFDLANTAGFWANLHLDLEPFTSTAGGTTPNSDTLLLKLEMTSMAPGVVWNNQFPQVWLDSAVGKWTEVVITYNGASGTFTTYENGTITGTNSLGYAYGPYNGTATLYANDPGSATNIKSAPVLGNLMFANATALVLGTWQLSTNPSLTSSATAQPWATSYTGAMDELRVYNSALNATDVKSLYILEKGGF
ncbi:MAG: hypothetical protein ACYCOO_07770 [Chitinophagaceae bacterium]